MTFSVFGVCARVCVCFACGRKDDVNDNGG